MRFHREVTLPMIRQDQPAREIITCDVMEKVRIGGRDEVACRDPQEFKV